MGGHRGLLAGLLASVLLAPATALPPASCHGQPDGELLLQPKGLAGFQVTARCNNGWTIIDPSISKETLLEWEQFFNSFEDYTFANILGPARERLLKGHDSSLSSWFKLSEGKEFRVSQDCHRVGGAGDAMYQDTAPTAYYSTGNFLGCTYKNTKCPMAFAGDQLCHVCAAPDGTQQSGTCTHMQADPYTAYPWVSKKGTMCTNPYNRYPVIGTSGRFCVAYREATATLPPSPAPTPPPSPALHGCHFCQERVDAFLLSIKKLGAPCGVPTSGCPDGCQAVIDALVDACAGTRCETARLGDCALARLRGWQASRVIERDFALEPSCSVTEQAVWNRVFLTSCYSLPHPPPPPQLRARAPNQRVLRAHRLRRLLRHRAHSRDGPRLPLPLQPLRQRPLLLHRRAHAASVQGHPGTGAGSHAAGDAGAGAGDACADAGFGARAGELPARVRPLPAVLRRRRLLQERGLQLRLRQRGLDQREAEAHARPL
jgi:hypothetical protein